MSYFLFTASTCERPYNIDSVDDSKLVLNSIFSPDQPMQVSLALSRPILSDSPRDLFGEYVEVIEPNGNVRVLNKVSESFSKWFVDSTFYPEAGVNYIINASAENFEPVISNNTIPEPVAILNASIDTFRLLRSSTAVNKTDHWISFDFQLEDKPGEHYYHLYAFRQKTHYTTNTGPIVYEFFDEYILNDLMIFNNPNGLIYTDNSILFKDEDGGTKNFSFEVGFTYFGSFEAIKKLRFELRTVSEEYYNFHVSKRKQELIANDEFAEPIVLFNNIEGGLGLFGGFSSVQIDTVTIN